MQIKSFPSKVILRDGRTFIVHGYEETRSDDEELYYGVSKEASGWHFGIIGLEQVRDFIPYKDMTAVEAHSTSKLLEEHRQLKQVGRETSRDYIPRGYVDGDDK